MSWLQALQHTGCFPHPVTRFEVIETHISWVLLTGDYAYKFKKPVDLGFLDFSTLARRHHFCEEELRLNARLAPQLYLAVVAVTGTPEAPRLEILAPHAPGPHGPVLEYGVQMRQFAQENQFDRLLARGALTPAHIDRLAERIARFHQDIALPPGPDTTAPLHHGSPEAVAQPVAENFAQLRAAAHAQAELQDILPGLAKLEHWSESHHAQLHDTLLARQQAGFIRECHGDMHLRNIALYGHTAEGKEDGDIVIFDGIEFSAELRWIDVMSEVAFLVMDLFDHERPALAWRFLDAYLMHTGDYAGLVPLPYYLVYRAMVRAKVSAIRLTQAAADDPERPAMLAECHGYLALAETFTRPAPSWLCLTHGVSGSGKSWYSQQLLETLGAIRLRSDVERKRLYGLDARARSGAAVDTGIYTRAASQRTYARLAELAGTVLDAGYPVIVDATFLHADQRRPFAALADARHIPWLICAFSAPEAVLRERVVQRETEGQDASEAGLAVLERQLAQTTPFDANEQPHVLPIASGAAVDKAALVAELRSRLKLQAPD